ncbi:MAG: hypothetical protein Kow0040_03800 [Thermogutta sp.]
MNTPSTDRISAVCRGQAEANYFFVRMMDAMPQTAGIVTEGLASADRLADLVRRKQACLAELLGVCRRQFELVESGDVEGLLELLAWKQRYLQEIQRLESEFAPYRHETPESRSWRSEDLRRETAHKLQDCRRLLAEILEIERHCEQKMTARREEISRRLHTLQDAAEARRAYAREEHAGGDADVLWEG